MTPSRPILIYRRIEILLAEDMTDISTIQWSAPKKLLFLFILCYTFFYIFPFPFDAFPQLDFIFNYYEKANNHFVLFVGKQILHVDGLKMLTYSDSGDTLFDFIKIFIFLFLSFFAAVALFIVDRKRNNYEKLQSYLYLYLRYCIGFYMLVYGFDKVFKSHFPFPSLEKLEQPLGESSPQGLLWAFMGYSTTYSVYLGIVEVCAGFLVLFRRTTALGALLVLLIMINITIINFSYDVPVKLFALHMVVFALILLWPFLNSVYTFFVLKKPAQLPEQALVVFPKFIQTYRKPVKGIVIFAFTALFISFSITNMKTDGDSAPEPELYGIFRFSGSNIPDGRKLREIIFDKKVTLLKWVDLHSYYTATVDPSKKLLLLQSNRDPSDIRLLHYDLSENILTLSENDSGSIQFRKVEIDEFPLINRGFHWVVEYPVNN